MLLRFLILFSLTLPFFNQLFSFYKIIFSPAKNEKKKNEKKKLKKQIRDGKVRLPDVVSKHGARLLSSKGWRTLNPDELWLVHEQVCLACLDTGDVDEAKRIIQKLDKRFPNR